MEQFEREATIDRGRRSTASPAFSRQGTVDSLTQLESYYQSKYEHYLAMATEAKENRERVGLLLQDICRDALTLENNFVDNGSINRQQNNGTLERRGSNDEKARTTRGAPAGGAPASSSYHLPSTESPSSKIRDSIATLDEVEDSSAAVAPEQMKKFISDLSIAMSVIESVSDSDSGKTLHQNYLHHLLNRELEQELSVELVELYLEEATRRGYLEPDEFNNNCYRGKPRNDSNSEAFEEHNEKAALGSVTTVRLSGRESGKPYDLPSSDKLKPTLFETIEGYIEKNPSKRFSIDDVINYLYPQPVQLDWDKALKNKVRASISNVLGRKAYLGKHWSRIKPGVYRPRHL